MFDIEQPFCLRLRRTRKGERSEPFSPFLFPPPQQNDHSIVTTESLSTAHHPEWKREIFRVRPLVKLSWRVFSNKNHREAASLRGGENHLSPLTTRQKLFAESRVTCQRELFLVRIRHEAPSIPLAREFGDAAAFCARVHRLHVGEYVEPPCLIVTH